jgi:hypothetical protein
MKFPTEQYSLDDVNFNIEDYNDEAAIYKDTKKNIQSRRIDKFLGLGIAAICASGIAAKLIGVPIPAEIVQTLMTGGSVLTVAGLGFAAFSNVVQNINQGEHDSAKQNMVQYYKQLTPEEKSEVVAPEEILQGKDWQKIKEQIPNAINSMREKFIDEAMPLLKNKLS